MSRLSFALESVSESVTGNGVFAQILLVFLLTLRFLVVFFFFFTRRIKQDRSETGSGLLISNICSTVAGKAQIQEVRPNLRWSQKNSV